MPRAQNLFALAAVGLLAFELLASQFGSPGGFTIGTQNRGYAFAHEMPLYGIAVAFVSMQLWFAVDLARALFKMRAT